MITTPDYIQLGRFTRQHNFEGALLLEGTRYLPDGLTDLETLFVAVEGLPVPFFPEEVRFTGDTTAIITLEDVDAAQSGSLVGCEVFCLADDLPDDGDGAREAFQWTGFRVFDAAGREAGTVTDAEDFSGNTVLHLDTPHGERLIPFHEDLLTGIDEQARILTLTIPDGLLDEQ